MTGTLIQLFAAFPGCSTPEQLIATVQSQLPPGWNATQLPDGRWRVIRRYRPGNGPGAVFTERMSDDALYLARTFEQRLGGPR